VIGQPTAVVLAGGLARRLGGGDKPLRLLGGRTILEHVIGRIGPQVGRIVINANGDPARFAAFGLPVVADTLADNPGPLAGVLAGMRWAVAHAPEVGDIVTVPGDTPFLPDDLVARLYAARIAAGVPIACAASGGRVHPVVGIWPVWLADALQRGLEAGERKIQVFTAARGVAEVAFSAEPFDPFFNINSPGDLEAAERVCRF